MQDISSTTAVYSNMRFYKTEVILILIYNVKKVRKRQYCNIFLLLRAL